MPCYVVVGTNKNEKNAWHAQYVLHNAERVRDGGWRMLPRSYLLEEVRGAQVVRCTS